MWVIAIFLFWPRRCLECFFNRPAQINDPLIEDRARYFKLLRPFADGFCNAVVGCKLCAASIGNLLQFGCPPAIFWAVWAVIVNSVNRVLLAWRLSHVGNKVLKRLPSIANVNPSAAILRVVHGLRVFAPVFHARPNAVDLRTRKAVGFWSAPLALLRSAPPFCIAQVRPSANLLGTAIADTQPLCNAWRVFICPAEHKPFAKTLAR